jgi:hypothetical protein
MKSTPDNLNTGPLHEFHLDKNKIINEIGFSKRNLNLVPNETGLSSNRQIIYTKMNEAITYSDLGHQNAIRFCK